MLALLSAIAFVGGAWYLLQAWLTPGFAGDANLLRAMALFTVVGALGVWRVVQLMEQRVKADGQHGLQD